MEMDRGKDLHPGLGKRKRDDAGTSLGHDAIRDDGSCCPPLLPKHKIFLSHCGKQKWFVEKLCEDLEARHRFPFFDKSRSSLPKGERFPKLILEAAERCEMAVVVVSDEFLTSKWPMIELSTFVRALSGSNPRLKILPLFFGMTVSDIGSPSRQAAWLEVWNKWAKEDPLMKLGEFEEALKVMRSFNGMVFNGDMNNVWSYERDVVKEICIVVGVDVKWEDSHVQGWSSICEATQEKIKEVKPSESGIRVFGYYGTGGIGKTTMCKALCNEFNCNEFSSKVCHVELGGTQSVEKMLKEMLKKLTNTSEEELERLDKGVKCVCELEWWRKHAKLVNMYMDVQCQDILRNRSSWRQRTFLAIDNVRDDHKSLEQAEMFLHDPVFYEGSVVMVTSRCRSTLMRVGVEDSHCFEVPELGDEDARKLFVHHVAGGKQFGNDGDNVVIDECIARCRFRKSDTQGYHYLPLALKVLGVHLRRCGASPAKWLEGLPEVRDFDRFEGDYPVFSIIRLNYDRLSVQLQALFMDVAVFWRAELVWLRNREDFVDGYFSALSLVHRQKLQDTQSQLQQLKERGLLEDVDMESETVSMHDLFKEFAEMETEGKLNSTEGLNGGKWVYYKGSHLLDLERAPSGGCWENLIRMRLRLMGDYGDVLNVEGIQWRYFSNLVVLSLTLSGKIEGVLNLEGLRFLRSLRLYCRNSIDGVDGLKDLKDLTYFDWKGKGMDEYSGSISLGQLPSSIKYLCLNVLDVCLRSDIFDRCTNLLELSLIEVQASDSLDLRQCTSLRSVYLFYIIGLQTLFLPSKLRSALQSLGIRECKDLSGVSGLGDLDRLHRLKLDRNCLLEVPDLQNFPNLQHLKIYGGQMWDPTSWDTLELCETCQYAEIRGLGSLEQLREICFRKLDARELPNLNALNHLHTLSLQECKKLTHLEGVEGLTALQRVDLIDCSSFSRLPDLSNSTKLEHLYLSKSGIELHEEDIDRLAALPGLRLVRIRTDLRFYQKIDLDPVRRKVLISGMHADDMVEERDLETLPIQLRSYGIGNKCNG